MGDEPPASPGPREPSPAGVEGVRRRVEELLTRLARLAQIVLPPLRVARAAAVIAGLLVWAMGPAARWGTTSVASIVALLVLLLPALRLHLHARLLQRLSTDLPTLVTEAERSLRGTSTHLRGISSRQTARSQPGSGGRVRRAWRLYREEVAPLRHVYGDALERISAPVRALAPPALLLTAVALAATAILVVLVPVLLLVRLLLG